MSKISLFALVRIPFNAASRPPAIIFLTNLYAINRIPDLVPVETRRSTGPNGAICCPMGLLGGDKALPNPRSHRGQLPDGP